MEEALKGAELTKARVYELLEILKISGAREEREKEKNGWNLPVNQNIMENPWLLWQKSLRKTVRKRKVSVPTYLDGQ